MGSNTSSTVSTTTISSGDCLVVGTLATSGNNITSQQQQQQTPYSNTNRRISSTSTNNEDRVKSLKRQASYKSNAPDSAEDDNEISNLVDKQLPQEVLIESSNKRFMPTSQSTPQFATDDEIKPIYSSNSFKTTTTRVRNKSNSSSLRDSLSSSTSSSSSTISSSNTSTTISSSTYPLSGTKSFKLARMNSLSKNVQFLPTSGSYNSWNTDSICWEEYKRRSIAQQKKNMPSPLPVNEPSPPQRNVRRAKPSNTPMAFKKEAVVNRVGMDIEPSPLSNFLKNLSASPSTVTNR